uniref:RIN4 pathogenic type III effector avirulence factor Avr cleavage site domain-containing protein n=1 Tax=Brassica oleracea var. oleracea TaxID=109376 RepID=A0A0D3BGB0_BRAOL
MLRLLPAALEKPLASQCHVDDKTNSETFDPTHETILGNSVRKAAGRRKIIIIVLSLSRFWLLLVSETKSSVLIPTMAMGNKGRQLPKFGEWDATNPGAAQGFTVIFNNARDDKKTKKTAVAAPESLVTPPTNNEPHQNNNHRHHRHQQNNNHRKKRNSPPPREKVSSFFPPSPPNPNLDKRVDYSRDIMFAEEMALLPLSLVRALFPKRNDKEADRLSRVVFNK